MLLTRGGWRMALPLLLFVPLIGWIALWVIFLLTPKPTPPTTT